MVNRRVILRKLMRFRASLARLEKLPAPPLDEFLWNEDAQDIVCRNLQIAIQACIDVASHVIADEGWKTPEDLAGLFDELHHQGVIDARTSEALKGASRFRNVLVHDYDTLDLSIVYTMWRERTGDLARFMAQLARHFKLDEPA